MNTGIRLSLLCSLPLLLNACASGQQPQNNEELVWKQKVEQRLDSLATAMPEENDGAEFARLEARISLLETDNRREYQDAQKQLGDISAQLAALKREIRSLRSSLSKIKSAPTAAPKEQAKEQQQEMPKPEPVQPAASAAAEAAKPADLQRLEERAKRAYYDAYFALKNGDYFEASLAFRNFLRDFPGTKLADEARYWHGESLLAQGDSAAAMQVFQDIIKQKSGTARHASAMLKAGFIYEEQKNMDEASSIYSLLIRQYPASSEAETARSRLKSNGSQG